VVLYSPPKVIVSGMLHCQFCEDIDNLMRQMSTSEKVRDVSGVELLMNNHQGHKAEIDVREDNFGDSRVWAKNCYHRVIVLRMRLRRS